MAKESYISRLRHQVGSDLLLVPGAAVVVSDPTGAILLGLRRDFVQWALPTGAAEVGSSFRKTAVDELKEETGMLVSEADIEPFGCLSEASLNTTVYPNGDRVHGFTMCFAVSSDASALGIHDGEFTQLAFFPPDGLPTAIRPTSRATLDLWHEYRLTGRFQAR